ncbi:MAG: hypothetical protein N4A76_01235 [Firmicutes bacterium]|nr:hypothetical protein [Bacillota bacterium]
MRKISLILVCLLLIQAISIDYFNYAESTITINEMIDMSFL